MKLEDPSPWKKSYDKPRQHITKQRYHFGSKGPYVKVMVLPVIRYGCESRTIKKAERQRIDAFKLWCWRRLENPLDSKVIKPVNPKGSQPWLFIGRTDAEPEAPILWPPDMKSQLVGPDTGNDWRQKMGMQKMRWLDSNTYSVDMSLSKLWEIVEDRGAWWAIVHGVTKELDTS